MEVTAVIDAPETFAHELLVYGALDILVEQLIARLDRLLIYPLVCFVSAEVRRPVVIEMNLLGEGDSAQAGKYRQSNASRSFSSWVPLVAVEIRALKSQAGSFP